MVRGNIGEANFPNKPKYQKKNHESSKNDLIYAIPIFALMIFSSPTFAEKYLEISVEPYSVALNPSVSDLEDLLHTSSHFAIRLLASAILMQEGGQNFPEVASGLVASSHFDIVVYPGAVSNKKARKAIPEKVQQYGSLSAYPNPTMGSTHLDYQFAQNPEEITVQVLTMDGRLVLKETLITNQAFGNLPLSVDGFVPGFYLVTLSTKSGEVVHTKLVKQ